MMRRVVALVAALSLLATGCGPDEPDGDLSRFAAPPAAG